MKKIKIVRDLVIIKVEIELEKKAAEWFEDLTPQARGLEIEDILRSIEK